MPERLRVVCTIQVLWFTIYRFIMGCGCRGGWLGVCRKGRFTFKKVIVISYKWQIARISNEWWTTNKLSMRLCVRLCDGRSFRGVERMFNGHRLRASHVTSSVGRRCGLRTTHSDPHNLISIDDTRMDASWRPQRPGSTSALCTPRKQSSKIFCCLRRAT